MIGWKDYPKPNLRFIRNVCVVEVSIPTFIRHLFGKGSGATNNKRKATGTIDKAIAERRVTELPPKGIGRLFDYKMNEDGLASHDAGRALTQRFKSLCRIHRKWLIHLEEH